MKGSGSGTGKGGVAAAGARSTECCQCWDAPVSYVHTYVLSGPLSGPVGLHSMHLKWPIRI